MEGNFFSIFIGFFVSAAVWAGILLLAIMFIVQRRALMRARRELEQAKKSPPSAASAADLADRLSVPTPAPRPAPTVNTLPTGTVTVKLGDGTPAPADPVLAVLRDKADGRLLVHLNGVAYRTLIDQTDARKTFTALMKELAQAVAETPPPRPSSTAPAPAVDTMEEIPLPPLDDFDLPDVDALVSLPNESPAQPRRPAAPIKDATQPQGTFDLPDYRTLAKNDGITPGGGFLRRGKLELSPLPELNIAGAIEAYLQHKLSQSNAFAGREIHVHPATDGGVVIEVDGMYFESVNDVSDDAARKFISAAIQEWQERQK